MKIVLFLLIILIAFTQFHFLDNTSKKHAAIPPNDFNVKEKSEWDNGYSEARFNYIIDSFIEIYTPAIEARGGVLKVKKDWGDGAVNAFAWREGNEYWLEILGGMSRYSLITEDAFSLTICHELGHLLGGKPGSKMISAEGQSDYYASMKCMRRILPRLQGLQEFKLTETIENICQDHWQSGEENLVCVRTLAAAKQLTALFAKIAKVPFPQLLTPDTAVAKVTKLHHPDPQCRLDTFLAGMICPVHYSEDFSFDDPAVGACIKDRDQAGSRPACWYRN